MAALLLAVVAGCGGSRHPSTEPAAARAPACPDLAAHLLDLAQRDNAAGAGPALAHGIVDELERQCRETPWSAARRTCLMAAPTEDDTVACPAR